MPVLITGILLLNYFDAFAVTMPQIFGDYMVLQRERPAPVWGWANPGEKVAVEFAGQRKETTASPDGRWELRLDPMPARDQGEVMKVYGADTNAVELRGVLVGEVWVCSGQSNMRRPVEAPEDIAQADLPNIRFINVAYSISSSPRRDIDKSAWKLCSTQTVGECTAVGFSFARRIQSDLGVPVGLINAVWSGTCIEPWIPLEAFDSVPELAGYIAAFRKKAETYRKTLPDNLKILEKWTADARAALAANAELPPEPVWPAYWGNAKSIHPTSIKPVSIYNAMVYPLMPCAMRGVIWYQGESNAGDQLYQYKMRALINSWRKAWFQGDFPFYFVQLANYRHDSNDPAGGDNAWARVRECQLKTLALTNTGMAVTIDIGEADNIHPQNKFDVGERLARWALARDYGRTNIVVSGPLYRKMKIEGQHVRLVFDHPGGGLMVGEKIGRAPAREVKNGKLMKFSIAGADKKWFWADAVIDGATVLVSSPSVSKPVAVRYAYSTNPEGCNLYNRAGLPASPFRTDAW